jgi:hypothetical protein
MVYHGCRHSHPTKAILPLVVVFTFLIINNHPTVEEDTRQAFIREAGRIFLWIWYIIKGEEVVYSI